MSLSKKFEILSDRWLDQKVHSAFWEDSLERQQIMCGWTLDIRFKIEWKFHLEAERNAGRIMKEMEALEK